jgi:glycosyltransferase involved in cell wall biosynthesis
MHVLFVHPNFPAQFGPVAAHLAARPGWRVSFASETEEGRVGGIEKVRYVKKGGATASTHYCSRTFENAVWHTEAVLDAMRRRPDIRPDLVVGHSGFGSTLFLPELYPGVPIVNLFEYFYRPHDPDSDMDFRRDLGWPTPEVNYLRARCRNAMILLDLDAAAAGYAPTQFQRSRFPEIHQPKIDVIFDGIDRTLYHGHDDRLRSPAAPRTIAGTTVPAGAKIVTYVSRGFESMRGFDIFMRAADIIARERSDVLFLVVGTDRHAYGGDENHIAPHATFKDWTLARGNYDLSRFIFTGRLPPAELGRVLASTDLHIYLTVPFVLSWSMMDAMSCGAVVLGSDTAPVREMIRDGENGLLADFFSPEDFASKALRALSDLSAHRPLGRRAEEMIREAYSSEAVLPRVIALYERAAARTTR